jgi:hypothetical protein
MFSIPLKNCFLVGHKSFMEIEGQNPINLPKNMQKMANSAFNGQYTKIKIVVQRINHKI